MKNRYIGYGALIFVGLSVFYFGSKFYMEKTVKAALDMEIEKITRLAGVRYDDLQVGIIGRELRLTNLVVTPRVWNEEIRIEKGVVYGIEREDGILSHIRFSLKGIRIDVSQPNRLIEAYVGPLDQKEIKADLHGTLDYKRKSRSLDIKQIKLDADGIGKAELNLRLKDIDPETFSSLPENIILLILTLSGVAIEEANITYQDDTLMEKVSAASARQSTGNETDYYKNLMRQLEEAHKQSRDPKVKNAIQGFMNFMKHRDKISIRMAPDKPVSIGKLIWIKDAGQLIHLLGIQVDA